MSVSSITSLNIPDACYKLVSKIKFTSVIEYANQLGYDVTMGTDKKEAYSLILHDLTAMFFVLPFRIIHKNIIQKRLKDINLKDGEACPDDKKLMKVIDIGRFLGSGKYGAVYFATLVPKKGSVVFPNYPSEFVLKLSAIPTSTYDTLKNGWDKSQSWNVPFRTKEVIIHYLINSLLTEDICPNFIFMYNWYLCNKCSHLQVKRAGKKVLLEPQECIIYILEKVDGDFGKMAHQDSKGWSFDKKEKVYRVAIFQTIMALAVLQKYYAIDHYDTGFRNIFYKEIHSLDNNLTYWTYKFGGNIYYVPNPGYMFFLADYGLSQSLRMFGQSKQTEPNKSLIGVDKKGKRCYRVYDSETNEITYPEDIRDKHFPDVGVLIGGNYNQDIYHTQDKGLAIFTKEMKSHFKDGEVQNIQDYLNQVFIDKTGKPAAYLVGNLLKLRELEAGKLKGEEELRTKMRKILGKNLVIPPVDYSGILEDLFKEWKDPPIDGICIGTYDADKSLPFNVDERYLEILRKKIY
jgi:hypothetical protein